MPSLVPERDRRYRFRVGEAAELELSAFKHVVVPIGVVIALGVARIVLAVSDYTQNQRRTRFALGHGLWSAILFLLFVGLWWILWGLRHIDAAYWTFFTLIYLLVGPCLLYMATTLILPAVPDQSAIDLGRQIEDVGRAFFLCLLGFVLWLAALEIWLLQEPWLAMPKRGLQGTAALLFSIGALRPQRRVATVLGVVFMAALVAILATIRARLI